MSQKEFWKIRSERYTNFQWATEGTYVDTFLSGRNFKKGDIILDVGTGIGIVAHAVSPFVNEIIGPDISQDMLDHSNWEGEQILHKAGHAGAHIH